MRAYSRGTRNAGDSRTSGAHRSAPGGVAAPKLQSRILRDKVALVVLEERGLPVFFQTEAQRGVRNGLT
jgi:hypothetical protein